MALALTIATACSNPFSPGGKLTELDAARQKWANTRLHDYDVVMQRLCFCANTNPMRVVVIGDSVRSATDTTTKQPVDPRYVPTVDGLFDFVERAIREHAQVIDVRYDPVRGYPTYIDYDLSSSFADEEVVYHVSDLNPVGVVH